MDMHVDPLALPALGLKHAVGDCATGVTGGDGAVYARGEDDGLREGRFAVPAEFAVLGGADLGVLGKVVWWGNML
jgi:hypothetical protein